MTAVRAQMRSHWMCACVCTRACECVCVCYCREVRIGLFTWVHSPGDSTCACFSCDLHINWQRRRETRVDVPFGTGLHTQTINSRRKPFQLRYSLTRVAMIHNFMWLTWDFTHQWRHPHVPLPRANRESFVESHAKEEPVVLVRSCVSPTKSPKGWA